MRKELLLDVPHRQVSFTIPRMLWVCINFGLYAHAHRGKVKKASLVPVALGMIEEEPRPISTKGWAEMIRKVYEVGPMVCPHCGDLSYRLPGSPEGR